MRQSLPASLLLATAAYALPEISLEKKRNRDRAQDDETHKLLQRNALGRRQDDDGVTTNVYDIITYSAGGAYYANITVGTPEQEMVVILDTGSSDLYFDAASAPACQSNGRFSCRGGEFDPGASSTYNVVQPAPAFNTSFGDGSTASGPFSSDTVCIGDVCVDDVQFGVATAVNSTTGFALSLLGLGYSENEATQHEYPNLPEVLKSAGVISSRLYSVFLNAFSQTSGSILFGGIDTTKYTGALETVNLLPNAITGQIDQFITTVTALRVNIGGQRSTIFSGGLDSVTAYGNNNTALPVLVDTGSAAWSVPESYYPYIAQAFPFLDQQGYCRCSDVSASDTITVTFADTIDITVPATEFILPLYDPETNLPYAYDRAGNDDACAFMIVPGEASGYGFQTIGDAVLRSMYVVFDLDNGQMALAQAAENPPSEPNIVTVPAGPSGVASALQGVASFEPASGTQSWSIAAEISGTATFEAETMGTTIGTATGTAAVPFDAQVSNTAAAAAAGGGGGSGGSGSGGGDQDGAEGVVVPGLVALGLAVGVGALWL